MNLPSNPSEAFKRANPHIYHMQPQIGKTLCEVFAREANATVEPSTDISRLNKTERAYLAFITNENHPWIGVQNVTLKLADDTRYTPDFVLIDSNGKVHAHEVKGFWRDDAKVKIKVAARQFAWIRFTVVMKSKGGWTFSQVKP